MYLTPKKCVHNLCGWFNRYVTSVRSLFISVHTIETSFIILSTIASYLHRVFSQENLFLLKMKLAYFFLLIVIVMIVDHAEGCDCDHRSGGCVIVSKAPRGLACRCKFGEWTCSGLIQNCRNRNSPKCRNPDASKESCELGGGDCGGYWSLKPNKFTFQDNFIGHNISALLSFHVIFVCKPPSVIRSNTHIHKFPTVPFLNYVSPKTNKLNLLLSIV